MKRLPWITIVVAALLALSPPGQDLFYLAFLSGEQLSRNIWQPFYIIAMLILVVLGGLEYLIAARIRRRRAMKTES